MFCGGDVMLNLPASTIFNRRIPKQKFYTNLPVSSKVVRLFTDQIDSIYWAHKLAPDTINVESGTSVLEIQILQIRLKTESLDESVITLIDREIPYHLVFVVCYQDHGQPLSPYNCVKLVSPWNKRSHFLCPSVRMKLQP